MLKLKQTVKTALSINVHTVVMFQFSSESQKKVQDKDTKKEELYHIPLYGS